MKRARANGDEQDAFSPWRHVLYWRRGELLRPRLSASAYGFHSCW